MDLQVSVLRRPSPLQRSWVVFPSPCLASFTPRVLLICRLLITAALRFSPRRSASSCPTSFFLYSSSFFLFLSFKLVHDCSSCCTLILHPSIPSPPPHLCPVKVEPSVPRPRRRPLPFCPCCSPAEGNVTEPPLPQVCWRRPFDLWNPPLLSHPALPLLCLFFRVCVCVCDQARSISPRALPPKKKTTKYR